MTAVVASADPPLAILGVRASELATRVRAYRRLTARRWVDLAGYVRGLYVAPLPVEVRVALLVRLAASAAVQAADLARVAGVPAYVVEVVAPAAPVRRVLDLGAALRASDLSGHRR